MVISHRLYEILGCFNFAKEHIQSSQIMRFTAGKQALSLVFLHHFL